MGSPHRIGCEPGARWAIHCWITSVTVNKAMAMPNLNIKYKLLYLLEFLFHFRHPVKSGKAKAARLYRWERWHRQARQDA